MDSKHQAKLTLIVLAIVTVVIAAIVILYKNYLMPWQIPLFKTRKALINYMKVTRPNYHIVKEEVKYYYTTGGGFLPQPDTITPKASVVCNENGFEYSVIAFDGEVTRDNYASCKPGFEVEEFIEKEFMEPRGIENVDFYCTFARDDELPSEWSEYTGRFRVTVKIRGQGTTPQEVGWLWDFYKFWRDNQPFNPDWNLTFDIYYDTNTNASWDSSISIHNTEKFGSKEEWYAKNTYPIKKPKH